MGEAPRPTARRAAIRGAELAYEWCGAATAPDMVWGHGLSQSREAEATVGLIDVAALPARVLRYDARGHGGSTTTTGVAGYGWDELARDQLALADALGVSGYVASGASMGCGTALHAAVLAPERITRCVLVIPPTAWETRAAQVAEWEAMADLIERAGVEAMIAARAQRPLPAPFAGDPGARDRHAAVLRAWDPGRLAVAMRGAGHADLPPRELVATISVPALILAWSGDPTHPVSSAEQLAELMPGATLHVASTPDELAGWTTAVAKFLTA